MICPRCDSDTTQLMATSPVGAVWEVRFCRTCCFSWRSTESEDITDPAKYDKRFKIDPATIPGLAQMPPIPPLRRGV
jgi:late competence protein required for DNA uptake (superfamily II DNA/RNA helicase)